MTKAKTGKKSPAKPAVTVAAEKGKTEAATMARVIAAPFWRHGILSHGIAVK